MKTTRLRIVFSFLCALVLANLSSTPAHALGRWLENPALSRVNVGVFYTYLSGDVSHNIRIDFAHASALDTNFRFHTTKPLIGGGQVGTFIPVASFGQKAKLALTADVLFSLQK